MQHDSGNSIRTRQNRDASIVHALGHRQHGAIRILVKLIVVGSNGKTTAIGAALHLRRKPLQYRQEVRRRLSGAAGVHTFKRGQGHIYGGVMVEQKLDEIIYRLRLQVELGCVRSDRSEALRRACIFHLRREEIQEDEVDVLNFVGAVFDELRRGDAVWNMAADAQSTSVRYLDDAGHEFRLERTVNLDLHISQIRVTVDRSFGLGLSVGIKSGRSLELAVAVDEASLPDPRTDRRSVLPLILQMLEFTDVVSHVTDSGHAAGDVH